jgi:hypothetical protein
MADPIVCPRCGSVQLSAHPRGYSGRAGCLGMFAFGLLGVFLGTAGSRDTMITCMACGKSWQAGTDPDNPPPSTLRDEVNPRIVVIALVAIVIFAAVVWFASAPR